MQFSIRPTASPFPSVQNMLGLMFPASIKIFMAGLGYNNYEDVIARRAEGEAAWHRNRKGYIKIKRIAIVDKRYPNSRDILIEVGL